MTNKKTAAKVIVTLDPSANKGEHRQFGGSASDDFNLLLFNAAAKTQWLASSDPETREVQYKGVAAALSGIAPRDEIEGMLAAQMIGVHAASMECLRRAMIDGQTFAGKQENLNQANKLSRTFAMLLDALNRHRGKGQQTVRVEHVHVHAGGQAIVGHVETGGGVPTKSEEQSHAQIAASPECPLRSENQSRQTMQIARNDERSLPNARRN